MADDIIKVSCPGCKAEFELPPEMGGEIGECTECGTVFDIPKLDDIKDGSVQTTDTGSIKVNKAAAGATNTLKLSRSTIGMVPDIMDNFKFSTATSVTRNGQTVIEKSATPAPGQTHSSMQRQAPPQKKLVKPWWKKLLFWMK